MAGRTKARMWQLLTSYWLLLVLRQPDALCTTPDVPANAMAAPHLAQFFSRNLCRWTLELLTLQFYADLPYQHRLSGGSTITVVGFCGLSNAEIDPGSLSNGAMATSLGSIAREAALQLDANGVADWGDRQVELDLNVTSLNLTEQLRAAAETAGGAGAGLLEGSKGLQELRADLEAAAGRASSTSLRDLDSGNLTAMVQNNLTGLLQEVVAQGAAALLEGDLSRVVPEGLQGQEQYAAAAQALAFLQGTIKVQEWQQCWSTRSAYPSCACSRPVLHGTDAVLLPRPAC